MSQKPACIQCGGTEYILESGFYFCSECQVQSQDIREEVFDDYWQGQKSGRLSIPAPVSQDAGTQESLLQVSITADKNITSWEVFNIILKGLVDELTLLGAPKELKLVVLQLWASYLMKTEVAFISKHVEKRPRLDLNFRKRDAELVYGTNKELINVYKKPIYRKKVEKSNMSTGKESSFANIRMQKYRLTKKTKLLAKAEYEQSSASSQASEITLESLTAKSVSSSSQKSYKLRYNQKSKTALSSMLDAASEIDNDARSSLQKKVFGREAKSLHHLSLSKLLAIIRLALLIIDSDIHLGDLLRWSAEGYLSLLNAEKLLPSSISIGKDIIPIFIVALNSREHINKKVMQMADSLVVDVSPRIIPLIERYLKELHLPDDLLKIIRMVMELSPPRLRLTSSVSYEGRAMAFIIFALKLLFGLDGITEKSISKVAKIINREQEKDKKRLFDWSEWVRYINCRSSVVSLYHQATRDKYHPTSAIGGSKPFLSHWEKLPSKNTFQRRHIIPPNVKDCLSRFLKDFYQEPAEPFPPSLSPLSSNLMEIFDKDLHIPPKAKMILEQEFTKDTIDYLYDEDLHEEISEKFNISFAKILTAKVVQVKPFVAGGKVEARPSQKGNKVTVAVKIEAKEGKSGKRKRNNVQLDMKRSFLPDSDDLLQGVTLKDRSDSFKENYVLPVCGRKYWIYHSSFADIKCPIGLFHHIAENVFPIDFYWLLKTVSLVAHVCPKDVYMQLSYVEKMYLQYLTKKKKPRKFFEHHW